MESRIETYRKKEKRLVAGVMSGTSLDGIDVAFVEISGAGTDIGVRLRGYASIPIDQALKGRLLDASSDRLTLRETFDLDADLGGIYARAILDIAESVGIDPHDLDAVGLHGQTVYHAPRRLPHGVSVQLGSAAIVAHTVGTMVVNDFRTGDVAAGGEGAPLVPYCDYVLLHSNEFNRVSLNVGGIANITWLPCDARTDSLVAFDTGPGNMLIDAAMRELYGMDYDPEGTRAAQGTPDENLLARLLADPYYNLVPPKSTGRERFGEEVGREIAVDAVEHQMFADDIIATLTLLTAVSIARGIRRFASLSVPVDEVIVAGGGARNATLLRMLDAELPESRIRTSDEYGIPADGKEALCFAVLANEALCEIPAGLPNVTGARLPVICGSIRLP